MDIPKLARKVERKLRRRHRPAILMYHRVAHELHDPWTLAVSPQAFEKQMAYLKDHRTVMSLDEIVKERKHGMLPPHAIAITFDDGYRDNLVHALPILAKHDLPATVFIATGYIGREQPFWWDELAAMILASPAAMHASHVCAGRTISLDWDGPERADRSGKWLAWNMPRTARQRSYIAIWGRLRYAGVAERDAVMHCLRQRLTTQIDPIALPMNDAELSQLTAGGLVQLGAHTVNHPSLPHMGPRERRQELEQSREMCSRFSTAPVDDFSYPFGDADAAVRSEVVDLGFSSACSTRSGFLDEEQSDLHLLPRITVRNCSLRSFINRITG